MTWLIWIGFLAVILLLLALDLGVLRKKGQTPTVRSALLMTGFYVALAMAFSVVVWLLYENKWFGFGLGDAPLSGHQAALQYVTGYLVEESLSVDNIFVIALIFTYFRVPAANQQRVLYWGILGAIVLRGAMIGLGAALVAKFSWMNYVFGLLLLATALRLLLAGDEEVNPESNFLFRILRRFYPVTPHFDGAKFFTMASGRKAATPLLVTLLVVESTDVLFAVDSIPAIFAITQDPFLVFTSNIFAILGLRSLYFALAGMLDMFKHLKTALVVLLAFIGVKMLLHHHFEISTGVSLAIVAGILASGVVASLVAARRAAATGPPGPA
jgi:tellurite resistance protein TerC